jgi:hypothetical protein
LHESCGAWQGRRKTALSNDDPTQNISHTFFQLEDISHFSIYLFKIPFVFEVLTSQFTLLVANKVAPLRPSAPPSTTMSYSQGLQIFCICFIFFVSLAGFYLPIYLSTSSSSSSSTCSTTFFSKQNMYLLMKCCGSGIILGVALVHLLADAVGDLGEYGEYPCKSAPLTLSDILISYIFPSSNLLDGLVIAGMGAIFTLGLDQLAHSMIIKIHGDSSPSPKEEIVKEGANNDLEGASLQDDKYIVGKCEHKCDHQHPHGFVSAEDSASHVTIKA